MDAHSVVDDWDTARFDGGFRGLEELESRGFSGAVEAAGNWLFFSDGDPLAVVSDLESVPQRGDIDAFEGADGRTHEAQTPWVAAVAAMLALDGEVRGRYFTDDTPLEAVHETLSDGGFTGYVELSENVLSGDYYFVYLDGEVGHVGFVGGSQWLFGEEAETKATNEIGIYAVTAVSLPRPELPDPPATEPDRADPAVADAPETTTDAGAPTDSDSDVDPDADAESEPEGSTPDATAADAGSETETEASGADPDAEPAADRTAEATGEPTDGSSGETEDEKAESDDQSDAAERSATAADSGDAASESTDETAAGDADGDRSPTTSESTTAVDPRRTAGSTSKTSQRNSSGIESVTTRTVPSLDPENTGRDEPDQASPPASAPGSGSSTSESSSAPNGTPSSAAGGQSTGSETHARSRSGDRSGATREEYEARIEEQAAQIETYESEIDDLEAEIDDLEAEIDDLEGELGDADSRIEELETELESIERERDELEERLEASGAAPRERSLSRAEALSETSLFARAIDKGEATLEDAHGGSADREAIDSNLRIEYHTEFEDRNATVEGEPFEAWLRSSDAHAFAEWLVTDLFFEIRSTGATAELGPLYDALPAVDRIGFDETIRVGDGTDGREVAFDIVARNKKGNPLVVVLFDRQRDPTRTEAIEPLVTDASDVCEAYDSLAGAVAITSSYFESDARAAVEEATSSSLLSRSKHRSYVKLSRTSGYHLCLVEYRDGSFNLTHPEL